MTVKEALEIIRESGKTASLGDYIDLVKAELQNLGFGEVTSERYVNEYYRKVVSFYFREGFTPRETAEHIEEIDSEERD
jgi:hypothetical protein